MNDRDYYQQASAAQSLQGQLAGAQGLGRGYAQETSARACDTTAPAEPLVQCAKTITVTVRGPLSARTQREFREEFAGKIAQGYRVKALHDRMGVVEVTLEKYESWTLDELMGDINAKLRGE